MKKITLLFAFLLSIAMASTVSAQTQLATPTVKSPYGVSTTGITANWTALAALSGATGYDVKIYDATNTLVSTHNVSGETTATLAITGLSLAKNTPYTYTVTAIGDGGVLYTNSAETAKSIAFYIQTDDQVVFQYVAANVATLNSDLKSALGASGAADIYELTESGGAYTFTGTSTANNTLVKNTIIRAAVGLANKPILKNSSTSTSSTSSIFNTTTTGLTIKFDGLEFSGANGGTGTSPLAFYSTATNTKLYVTNCYFHDFLEASTGNGAIRFNPSSASSSAVMDIQGSVFNNCGARVVYNDGVAGTTLINIKNCTFSNLVALKSRCNAVYNTAANAGTQTYDHCTFYNIPTSTISPIFIKGLGGAILIQNSLFGGVSGSAGAILLTQPLTFTTTIKNCYVGGLATAPSGSSTSISGTIATTPLYTNAATLDFSLTNKSSFLVTTDGLVAGNTIYYSALPKLSTPTVGVANPIGTNGFTANWSTVANASGGYSVKVYEGGVTLINTTPVAGQSSTSVAITGLKTGTSYTFTVTAIGDAISYDNSLESTASTSFSTLGLSVPVVGTASVITTSSFTANWTPVANASSYNVLTYLTTNLVSTSNIVGQASSNVSITGLAMGTTYTYKVEAVGDGVTYTNSDPSASSAIAKTLAVSVSALNPNFSDGTWGAVTVSSPALGSYPVFSANGWDLTHAQVKTNTAIGIKGEAHPYVLSMDKTSNSGVVLTPVVTSVAEIEIHSSATAGRQYLLQSSIDGGNTWVAVGPGNTGTAGTYFNNSTSLEQIDIIPTGGLTNAQFKITDPSSGAYTFYEIISRTSVSPTMTVLPAPTGTITASNISNSGFTATWSNTVPNATGYKVNVYSNKLKTLVTSATVSDPNALTLNITSLQADSTYLYGVVGLGDNITYSDGYILMGASTVTMWHKLTTPVLASAPWAGTFPSSLNANWTAVANASSYDVSLYEGASAGNETFLKTVNVVGQASTSVAIDGASANKYYTFTVVAIGDGITYFNSDASVQSSEYYNDLLTKLSDATASTRLFVDGKTITAPQSGKIEVFNLQGGLILQAQSVTKVNTNLASGMYIVRFTNNGNRQLTQKINIR